MTEVKKFTLEYTSTNPLNEDNFDFTGVVIVAAGNSSRMGSKDKILEDLAGFPVIVHTITAFNRHPAITKIVIVANKENIFAIQNLVSEYKLSKVCDIVVGGNNRQESAQIGAERLFACDEIKNILIHDGARPLVSSEIIDRVIKGVREFSAVIPVTPVKETVKKIGALGKVEATVERNNLVNVQTPQGFTIREYKSALSKTNDLSLFTDDASVVEAAGTKVYTVSGEYTNIKITTPEDLIIARAYLNM